ncbi:adrenocorticotropic hormone receptor-like [Patiria miniata]|uniref:G-protein coupled receptors family 1 profile domain-containing protein n=1 Tax=Patiria miniata TaxID=46514 RepID=A0A913ZTW7_PATMI|nr:adrenocorticotropic hormone receptor-like [Patiria miniata]
METTWSPDEGITVTTNTTGDKDVNEFTSTTLLILVKVVTVLAIFLCVLLNPLMLFTLRRVTSIQPTTKIFMASLTLCDLCNSLCWILPLTELFAGSWLLGEFLCVVHGVTRNLFVGLSINSLLLLTMDRYIAISHSLRYPSIMTVFRSKIIVFSTWATVSILCTLVFGIHGNHIVSLDTHYLCLGHYDWRNYLTLAVVVIIILSIFILYAHIATIACNQARRIAAENQAGNGQGGQRINTTSTTTIIIITGTLLITWIPTVIGLVMLPQSTWTLYDRYLCGTLTQVLLLCNGWLNVMIYYLRNRDLRQAIRSLLSEWHQSLQQRFCFKN